MEGVARLTELLSQTLNPNPAIIKQAEGRLAELAKRPQYGAALLTAIGHDSPVEIRQAAAVTFKNYIKRSWVVDEDADNLLSDEERDQIKTAVFRLMLTSPAPVRAQLGEALTIIGKADFPHKWPTLLPQVIEGLQKGDAASVNGVLDIANSILKRYRSQGTQAISSRLNEELIYLQTMVRPLLEVLQKLTQQLAVASQAQSLTEAKQLLSSIRLNLRVFYSLNSPGLTEDFEKTLDQWMDEFHKLLTFENAALVDKNDDRLSPVDAVKCAVCQNINLIVNRDEEEFAKFLPTFVEDVWKQLLTVSNNAAQEPLTMAAIQFLTTVSKSAVNATQFKSEGALKSICEKIIIPNLKLNEDLEEMFEMNFVEYVRRDTEGSDLDTRRRAATEFVKALSFQFQTEVTTLFTEYVRVLLAEASANREANWRSKDAAMYLVTALAVTGQTATHGATITNQLFNIREFYQSQVLPELQERPDAKQILQADALKYVTMFRSQLSKEDLKGVLPHLANLLSSESNVVHSYAAILLERLLASKDNGKPRFAVEELNAYLPALLEKIFAAFSIADSAENEYLMKCLMRLISFVGPQIAPVAPACLKGLTDLLMEVCKNPKVPGFNHYLFESVAALIKNSAANNASSVATLEDMLFQPFDLVLANDVQEFHPYVFQIFSQMIELRASPLPDIYLSLLQPFLSPELWERPGNVPALTRLIRAYLAKAAAAILQRNLLAGILGVFQKLVSSKSSDHEGFKLLRAVFEHVPEPQLAPYVTEVYRILFQRLQSAKTNKYVGGLLTFLSWLVVFKSVNYVENGVNQVQAGLFRILLEQIWIPNLSIVNGYYQRRTLIIASTKILCESPTLRAADSSNLWGQALNSVIAELDADSTVTPATAVEDDDGDDIEYTGYSAAFARLHNAAVQEPESPQSSENPAQFLANSLAKLSQAQPGHVPQLIQAQVPQDQQQKLQSFCQASGVAIN